MDNVNIKQLHPAFEEILSEAPSFSENSEDQLFILLEASVSKLLQKETEKLLQILYRLDVSEQKVREYLQKNPESRWPQGIALLIIEREKERQRWRSIYQKQV